jgi:MYXO-CTERM domain-containing protein
MKRLLLANTLGLSLLTVGLAGLCLPTAAHAQGSASSNRDSGAASTQDTRNDRGSDWGWLGLLGLVGLAGMRRRPDYQDETARRRASAS